VKLILYQVKGKVKDYVALQISNAILNGGLTVLLVVTIEWGVTGRLYAYSFSICFIGIIVLYTLYRDRILVFNFRKDYVIDALYFGIPLIPHTVGSLLLLTADRVIVNSSLGVSSAGIYMVAVQIALGVELLFVSLNKAFVPKLFEILKTQDIGGKIKIVKLTYGVFFVSIITVVTLYYSADTIIDMLVGERYNSAVPVLQLIFIMQGFHGMYYMVTNYLFYEKKNHYLALVTIVTGGLNVVCSLYLVQDYGMVGVAFSSAVMVAVQFIIVWYLAQKVHPMPWGL